MSAALFAALRVAPQEFTASHFAELAPSEAASDIQRFLDDMVFLGILWHFDKFYRVRALPASLSRAGTPTVEGEPAQAVPAGQPVAWQWRRLGEQHWRDGGIPASVAGDSATYELRGTFGASPPAGTPAAVSEEMVERAIKHFYLRFDAGDTTPECVRAALMAAIQSHSGSSQ